MKSFFLFIFLLGLNYISSAQQKFTIENDLQYAVIKDTDGFVNIRKAPANNAPVIGKIYNYSIFSCESNKTNWWKILQVDEHDKSYWLEGYIYKDRVSLLPTQWKFINRKSIHADSGILTIGSLFVTVKKTGFNLKKHKLHYQSKELTRIDGKLFWGTDGEIPKEKISSLKIITDNSPILIPKAAFDGLYEPHLETLSATKASENTYYVKMINSDGAGGYTVIWILKNNKYLGRYIDDSED